MQYSIVGYSTQIGNDTFGDTGTEHSPIIGWAYDGNQYMRHMVIVIQLMKIQLLKY